ncbi:MAG TPA: hypothetical protein PLF42_11130, partial [Anaerolineales bacterium]|nr:hypothetical protein [Anaerolineales bacterium]
MHKQILIPFLLVALLLSCSPQSETQAPSVTNTPSPTSLPTSTHTPIPTSTATPTPTPLPMAGPVTEDFMTRIGKGWVNDLTFSPNGKILSVATSIGVYLYQVEKMELISFLPSDAFVNKTIFINDFSTVQIRGKISHRINSG